MKTRRLMLLLALVMILSLPLHAQWEVGAGIEYVDSPRMGWSTFVTHMLGSRIGWTGEAGGVTDSASAFGAIGTLSSSSSTSSPETVTNGNGQALGLIRNWLATGGGGSAEATAEFDAFSTETRLSTYTFTSGPSIRLMSRGSVDLDCRGTVGTIYRELDGSAGFWRFASRNGCGLAYNFDSESAVRVNVDYLYASPGAHVPVIAARYYLKF